MDRPLARWHRLLLGLGLLLAFTSLLAQLTEATDRRAIGTLVALMAGLACIGAAQWMLPASTPSTPRARRWSYALGGLGVAFGLIALFGFN